MSSGTKSIFQARKDVLTLKRHGGRTINGLRARIGAGERPGMLRFLPPVVVMEGRSTPRSRS